MKKEKNKGMQEKVTLEYFFSIQLRIIRELFEMQPWETIGIIFLSCMSVWTSFVELRFLEYVTNSVSIYLDGAVIDLIPFGVKFFGFLLVLFCLRFVTNSYEKIRARYESLLTATSEQKIIKKLSEISYEYYESNQFYEKINLAKQACGQYGNAVYGVTEISRILLMLIVYGAMLSRLNIGFVFIIFIGIIISSVVSAKVTDKQLDFWRIYVSPESRRNYYYRGILEKRVQHATVQTGRSFLYFSSKYKYYNDRERKNYLRLNFYSFSSEVVTSLLFIITFGITAVAVGRDVAIGKYEIGYFNMVIALVINLFSSIKSFSMFALNDNMYVRVLDAYYEVLLLDNKKKTLLHTDENTIELIDLSYHYPQAESYAINRVNATFHMGQKIALVGLNGSGKSTLVSVILGLLEGYGGFCKSDGTVATAIFQDFVQYQMSIKENIEMGCGGKELSEEDVWEIIREVGLFDAVRSKTDGIYTKLGQLEKGIELSMGQWQRLAVGRLLANREAKVWILDEPTAYLDPIAEVEMYQLIFRLAGDRLVFFISHRLGFAKMADQIVVIDNGYIVEEGTHKELLGKKDGIYAAMYEAQKEWYA